MASYWDIMDIFLSFEGKYILISASILNYTQEVGYDIIKIIFINIFNIWKQIKSTFLNSNPKIRIFVYLQINSTIPNSCDLFILINSNPSYQVKFVILTIQRS